MDRRPEGRDNAVGARGLTLTRDALVRHLAGSIDSLERPHPCRVAIDGPDAAGKTTLADELAAALRGRQRVVIRASIDGFHRPHAERYRLGQDSPQGDYNDSFDYQALRRELLDPLGPNGSRRYRVAVFDYRSDNAQSDAQAVAPDDAILLFDDNNDLARPILRSQRAGLAGSTQPVSPAPAPEEPVADA